MVNLADTSDEQVANRRENERDKAAEAQRALAPRRPRAASALYAHRAPGLRRVGSRAARYDIGHASSLRPLVAQLRGLRRLLVHPDTQSVKAAPRAQRATTGVQNQDPARRFIHCLEPASDYGNGSLLLSLLQSNA